MVVPVTFSFWFKSYTNLQTPFELTADKMQNLLIKQELEDAYNTDFHESQKKLSLELPYGWGNRKFTFSK